MKWFSFVAAAVLMASMGCGGNDNKTDVKGEGGEKLTLTAPSDTSIKQGTSEEIAVNIKREKFDGPVVIEFLELPDGVTVDGGLKHTIGKGETKGAYKLTATDTAAVKAGQNVKVTASVAGKKFSTESKFKVAVKEMAKKEKEKGGLTLTEPKDTAIKAGNTTTVTVNITRDKFDDDVVIKFEDLPKGVTVEEGAKQTISKGSSEKTYTLKAEKDAPGKEGQVVKVHASSGDLKADGSFKLDVVSK
jgi:hypothetical protein